ncbi:hypothetical protein [Campylobacter hyointestinalis]|uniref:hypothetical protein n=1 Tax=Campylobacter hyointestinalis TaxID=198 RepID=UPI000DCE0315|nr:hypothetical protein [Campylobacter hyointestinalis]RAZ53997.1 hypothetical protein CHL10074_08235 [Campylobacter hyointestinalis subsp. lawsonii]RAZ63977.1 hypothetical protein CHL9767_05255 [Campylobacter hyointestinalis subsp. lawsonii]
MLDSIGFSQNKIGYTANKTLNLEQNQKAEQTITDNSQKPSEQTLSEPPAGFSDGYSYGMYDYETNGVKNIFYYANIRNEQNGFVPGTENEKSLIKEAFDLLFQGGMRLSDLVDNEHFGELFTKEFASEADVLAYAKKLGDDRAIWIDSIKQPNFEDLVVDMSENNTYSSQPNKHNKADEIERNNRMLMRQYNGAKSRNSSFESKNEILKTFFEEFLKNNNPLEFLEIMKKTDIKA